MRNIIIHSSQGEYLSYDSGIYIEHHGILGQKWGIRRYQNKDGSLTSSGKKRYGKQIQKMEKKAVQKTYKEDRKNGGSFVFKSYRQGTGENYKKAKSDFNKKMINDSKYKELSKKAFDAEKKRLMSEKKYINDEDKYNKYLNTKKAKTLDRASMMAADNKRKYAEEQVKKFVNDDLKNAKIKDLKITEHIDIAKQYLKNNDYVSIDFDDNLEYNPDNYYDKWVDKEKFK